MVQWIQSERKIHKTAVSFWKFSKPFLKFFCSHEKMLFMIKNTEQKIKKTVSFKEVILHQLFNNQEDF